MSYRVGGFVLLLALLKWISGLTAATADRVLYPRMSFHSFDHHSVVKTEGFRPLGRDGIILDIRDYQHEQKLISMHLGSFGPDWTRVITGTGLGGGGFSMAPGFAEHILSLAAVKERLPKHGESVVVLGGGVIGLTIAHKLLTDGIHVRVVSDTFDDNVSHKAGAMLSPVSVVFRETEFLRHSDFHTIQDRSFRIYKARMEGGWPVESLPMFITEEAGDKAGLRLFQAMPEHFPEKRHGRFPIEGVREGGHEIETLMISSPAYLRRMRKEILEKGGTLEQKSVKTLQEAVALAQEPGSCGLLFNCTGLGAKKLAPELNLVPVRGSLIHLKDEPNVHDVRKYRYMAFYGKKGTDYIFHRAHDSLPTNEVISVIGGEFNEGVAVPDTTHKEHWRIWESARKFYGWN